MAGGGLRLNGTMIWTGGINWAGKAYPNAGTTDSFEFESYIANGCSTTPCVHSLNGGGGALRDMKFGMPANNGIGLLSDGGGGSAGVTLERLNFTQSGTGLMNEMIELRGFLNASSSGACNRMAEVLLLGNQFSIGQTATPLFYGNRGYCQVIDSMFLNGGGNLLRFDVPGGVFKQTWGYRQGGYMPYWTITAEKESNAITGATISLTNITQDTDPECSVTNMSSAAVLQAFIALSNVGPPSGAPSICGNPVYNFPTGALEGTISGPTSGANINANGLVATGAEIGVIGTTAMSQIGSFLPIPLAPTAVLSAGGGVPTGNQNYAVAWVDANGNSTSQGANFTINVTPGNQTVTVTPPAIPGGAVGVQFYRNGLLTGPSSLNCGPFPAANTFVDTLSFVACGTTAPKNTLAMGNSLSSNNGVTGSQFKLVGGGFASTLSGTFTGTHAVTMPDLSGTLPIRVTGASTAVVIGSGTSIGSTQLCSSANCPAGNYRVNAYLVITTACTTTGTYLVNLIYTDDQGSKTAILNIQGSGAVPATGVLALSSTANYGQAAQIIRSTGAASINYSTTATACGTGGPMVGNLYLSVEAIQ